MSRLCPGGAGQGLGYGLLRYLNAETAGELAGLPAPQIGFNYLGRFAGGSADQLGMRPGPPLGSGVGGALKRWCDSD